LEFNAKARSSGVVAPDDIVRPYRIVVLDFFSLEVFEGFATDWVRAFGETLSNC